MPLWASLLPQGHDHCLQLLTHGNTLLKDDEVEKLTLLRMNKEFMKFMRKNYSHLTKQQFNMTIITP